MTGRVPYFGVCARRPAARTPSPRLLGRHAPPHKIWRSAGHAGHAAPSVPLETSGCAWYEGRRQCRKLRIQRLSRERRTSRTGTFFEAHRLAKRVLDLHVAEREPFLKSGAEQQVMDTAKVEGQDRLCHIVPLQ